MVAAVPMPPTTAGTTKTPAMTMDSVATDTTTTVAEDTTAMVAEDTMTTVVADSTMVVADAIDTTAGITMATPATMAPAMDSAATVATADTNSMVTMTTTEAMAIMTATETTTVEATSCPADDLLDQGGNRRTIPLTSDPRPHPHPL